MNRNQKTFKISQNENSCNSNCSMICRNELSHDGFMEFDIFLYSNSFQEKLPIVYANIRV